MNERLQLRNLEKEVHELRMESEFLKTRARFAQEQRSSKKVVDSPPATTTRHRSSPRLSALERRQIHSPRPRKRCSQPPETTTVSEACGRNPRKASG
jgi:hypothetical protein